MRIDKIATTPFAIPLSRPMNWGNSLHKVRRGLHLSLTNEMGNESLSEISPLPSYSRESLAEATEQMAQIRIPLKQVEFSKETWHTQLQELFLKENITPFPSVLFGIETALHSLLFGETLTPEVNMQGLLLGNREEILEGLNRTKGMQAIKLKLFALPSIKEAISVTEEVLDILGSDTSLRIDVNKRWSDEEALTFGKAFYPSTFEYIEEPMRDFKSFEHFRKVTGHPIAVDDSLRSLPLFDLLGASYIDAFVLKPTMMGGMKYTLGVAKMVKNRGATAVLSSSVESSVGLHHLKKMAGMMPDLTTPVGLDTMFLFADALATV